MPFLHEDATSPSCTRDRNHTLHFLLGNFDKLLLLFHDFNCTPLLKKLDMSTSCSKNKKSMSSLNKFDNFSLPSNDINYNVLPMISVTTSQHKIEFAKLWHLRLAHILFTKMKIIFLDIDITNIKNNFSCTILCSI